MKIFHGTVEIAGQMGVLVGALKQRGHLVSGYNFFHSYLNYQRHLINTDKETVARMRTYSLDLFDIYHFHYCYTFTPDFSDLYELRAKGKKVIMHHWGDDVRQLRMASRNNPYVNTSGSYPDEVIQQRLEHIAPYIDAAIVQDAEVLHYVTPFYNKAYILPIAIDLDRFPLVPHTGNPRPLIVHAPTNPGFKGTEIIERVLAALGKEFDFDYVRVEKMSNEEAVALYRRADLIVDQVLCGSYGMLACEAMALGKPVVCFIREDLKSQFPSDLPIISAHPDTLEHTLRELLRNPDRMAEAGRQGRPYVERVHDIQRVCDQLLDIYAQI